jgi:hypothetical protein
MATNYLAEIAALKAHNAAPLPTLIFEHPLKAYRWAKVTCSWIPQGRRPPRPPSTKRRKTTHNAPPDHTSLRHIEPVTQAINRGNAITAGVNRLHFFAQVFNVGVDGAVADVPLAFVHA